MCVTVRIANPPQKKTNKIPHPPLSKPALSRPSCPATKASLCGRIERSSHNEAASTLARNCSSRSLSPLECDRPHCLTRTGGNRGFGRGLGGGGHVHARTCVRTHRDASGSERSPPPMRGMQGIWTYLGKFCVLEVCDL